MRHRDGPGVAFAIRSAPHAAGGVLDRDFQAAVMKQALGIVAGLFLRLAGQRDASRVAMRRRVVSSGREYVLAYFSRLGLAV